MAGVHRRRPCRRAGHAADVHVRRILVFRSFRRLRAPMQRSRANRAGSYSSRALVPPRLVAAFTEYVDRRGGELAVPIRLTFFAPSHCAMKPACDTTVIKQERNEAV